MENSVVRFVAGSVRDLQPTTGIACVYSVIVCCVVGTIGGTIA